MSYRQTSTLLDQQGFDAQAGTELQGAGNRFDPGCQQDIVFELRGTKNTGTSLDVDIEDSFDDGTTWNTVFSFAQLTADGSEVKTPGRPMGGTVRALVTSVGDGWDARVLIAMNPLR